MYVSVRLSISVSAFLRIKRVHYVKFAVQKLRHTLVKGRHVVAAWGTQCKATVESTSVTAKWRVTRKRLIDKADTACCWRDRLWRNKHWYLLTGNRCVSLGYPELCRNTNFITGTGNRKWRITEQSNSAKCMMHVDQRKQQQWQLCMPIVAATSRPASILSTLRNFWTPQHFPFLPSIPFPFPSLSFLFLPVVSPLLLLLPCPPFPYSALPSPSPFLPPLRNRPLISS